MSPFNDELFLRIHRGDGLLLAVRGDRIEIDASGGESRSRLDGTERIRFLVEEIGLDESLARRVPADRPTPPPPGNATACRGTPRPA